MNNEIKEMKEIIAQATIEAEGLPFLETNEHIATALYETGYRKQQSTVDEFVARLLKFLKKSILADRYDIMSLAKEFGVESEIKGE